MRRGWKNITEPLAEPLRVHDRARSHHSVSHAEKDAGTTGIQGGGSGIGGIPVGAIGAMEAGTIGVTGEIISCEPASITNL
jgi:hypothetical protein